MVWAARRVGRPVKWTSDRTEAFLTDYNARDVVTKARLGFSKRGRILAMDLELTANTGAHTVSYVPLSNGYRVAADGLRRAGRACAAARRHDQHGADRAVPRRRPAGGDVGDGAPARHRGAPAEDRPRRAAPPQSHSARQAAASHRDRPDLRQRHVRRQSHPRAGDRRLGRLRQAPRRSEEARPAPGHRHRQLCRDPGRHAARARQGRGLARQRSN